VLWVRISFIADPDPDPPFISMRFRIQVARTFRIHPDPDPSQTLKSQKVGFYIKQVIGQKHTRYLKKLKKNFGKAGK
jgi:hypothetical protein